MAISEAFANSGTLGTTEHFLASNSTTATYQTTDGIYQLFLEVQNLVAGDVFEVRVYEKVQSASTARVVFLATLANAQSEPVFATPALVLLHGWEFSVKRTAGADRSIAWSIRSVA